MCAAGLRLYGVEDVRELLDCYLEILKRHFGGRLVSVAVFGSLARGEATSESDIDLLVVVEGLPVDAGLRMREMAGLRLLLRGSSAYRRARFEGLPRLFSEVVLTPEEVERHPPILLDITVDGVILYDRGGFLRGVLERLRRRLRELGARRVVVPGKGWYWILKPDAEFGEVIKI